MAEQRQRYSFSQAAAQQPERQRFSFSAATPQKASTPDLRDPLGTNKKIAGATAIQRQQRNDPVYKLSQRDMSQDVISQGPKESLLDRFTSIFKEAQPSKLGSFAKEVGQGTARDIAILGKPDNEVTTPTNDIQRFLFGNEPFNRETVGREYADLVGKGEDVSSGLASTIGVVGGVLSLPGRSFKALKEATQLISKTNDVKLIGNELRRIGVDNKSNDFSSFVKSLKDETDTKKIQKSINDFVQKPPTPPAPIHSDIKKTTPEKAAADLIKEDIPVANTLIRKNWEDVPNTVRQQFLKKYNLLGSDEAVVKSFLREALDLYDTRWSGVDEALQGRKFSDIKRAPNDVDVPSLPKIEQRFIGNFPEFKSAARLDELRNRTRSPQSNADSLAKAKELGYTPERVLRIPEGKALNAEEKMAVSGVVENERLVLNRIEERLQTLTPNTEEFDALRAEAARQKVKVFQMMAVERGVAAEAGRALQAHKATVTAIDQAENKLAKYLSKKSTPQETKDYIYRKIEEFDGSPDELNNLLRELDEATLLEKFVEYSTAAKLWNPTTHAVNMLTSTTRMFLQSPLHALSAAFDSVLSKLTGKQRERFLSDAFAEVQGQYVGWKHAGHEAAKALKDENYAFESRILKDFEVRGPAIKGRPGKNELRDQIANGLGKVVRIPFRMLGVEDTLVRKPSEMGALYTAINRKARMEGIKPGTKEWNDYVSKALNDPVGEYGVEFMKEVQDIADQNLFQESLHPTLKRVSNWREDVPALKLVVPFFRTIVNLQKQAIEFSALAPILPGARKALREGGGARSDVLAKMTLGTAVTIPLMHHAMEGNMTMAAPTNPAERDAFYAEGKQPYSVRLGDTWYSYNRFSPFSEWFITSAALAEAYNNEDEKSAAELVAHVFFSMTQNFFDKSFATGMHDLMEALADPERAGNWVENFATGATIPNFIPLAARVTDPVIRETDNLRDAYVSKVPYLSKTLDPKRDVFGKPISRPGNAIQKIISPVIPSPVEVDMVREELKSIGYQMGFPGKTAGGFEMDDETYRIYQAASGKITYKALSQLIQSPGYQNLNPRQRERAVDKIVRETRELVKNQVAQEQLIMQEIKDELKNQGYSSQQADDLAVKTYEVIKRRQEAGQVQ